MVKAIYQEALNLTEKQSLDVSVESEKHGFSFRTMFYRERKKHLEQGVHVGLVVSSIKEANGTWIVTIKNQKSLILTLHKEDGTSKELSLDFGIGPATEEEIPDDIVEILKKHREKKDDK